MTFGLGNQRSIHLSYEGKLRKCLICGGFLILRVLYFIYDTRYDTHQGRSATIQATAAKMPAPTRMSLARRDLPLRHVSRLRPILHDASRV